MSSLSRSLKLNTMLSLAGGFYHSITNRMFASSLASHERSIKFNTCRELYTSKVKSNLFRHCDPQGIQVEMKYIDTLKKSADGGTVLAIHGAPGSYEDFAGIIERLTLEGNRVSAPNLPDISLTHKSRVYYHSTEEKYEMLTDFLRHIDAPTIDVAIVHSAGVYPLMKLWHERPEFVRSLVLLNPAGHRRCKAMKPALAIDLLALINLSPIGRLFWQRAGVSVVKMLGHATKISKEESDGSLTALLSMHMAGVERLEIYFEHLRRRQTPTTFFYSDQDKLIDWNIYVELLALLGTSEENASRVSLQDGTVRPGPAGTSEWLKTFRIEKGGHFGYKNCQQLVASEVLALAKRTRRDDTEPAAIGARTDGRS